MGMPRGNGNKCAGWWIALACVITSPAGERLVRSESTCVEGTRIDFGEGSFWGGSLAVRVTTPTLDGLVRRDGTRM